MSSPSSKKQPAEVHAKTFLSGASAFRDAARHLIEDGTAPKTGQQEPIYFLLHHAVELCFKAQLRHLGLSTSELRAKRFGHSLSALFTEAKRILLPHAAQLAQHLDALVALLDEANKGQGLRYGSANSSVPDCTWLLAVLTELIDFTEDCVRRVPEPQPGMVLIQVPYPDLKAIVTFIHKPEDHGLKPR